MTDTASGLLAATTLVVDEGPFTIGAWPRSQASAVHSGVLRARRVPYFVCDDDKETSALVHQAALRELPPPLAAEHGFCLLTLDLVMAWDVIGVLAAVTSALAGAGVSVGAITAFSRDHVLVKARSLPAALTVLRPLCKDVIVRARA